MKRAKVREQLKKLKALAEGNTNPHEAAAATEKLREFQELLSTNVRGIFEKVPGSGVWWIRYTDAAGKYRREKVGAYGLAIKLLDKRRGEAVTGRKLPETLRSRSIPFSELADDAIAYVKEKYSRPADDIARLELLKERFSVSADMVSPKLIKNTLNALTAEKRWSASSRNHHHNLVSLAFRLGIEQEKVSENPARAVRREPQNNSRVRFLTPDEEKKLREAVRSRPEWSSHEVEIDLALHTGLRRSSMYLRLIWENVDVAGRVAIIPITKNGEQVVVPLNDAAMRALAIFRARGNGEGRVVRNVDGQTLTVTAHWFPPAVRAAGIKNFRWHDLRHTYASRLRQAGVPLGNISELLGHKGLAMTRRYAHLSISNLHEAVSRISKTISTSVAPTDPMPETSESYVN